MKDAGITAIWGARGSGKSTKAREIAEQFDCCLALDPIGDWGKEPGWKPVPTLQAMADTITANWQSGFKLAYTPPTGKEAGALHHISELLMQFQAGYHSGQHTRKICLLTDEMAEAYSNAHAMREDLPGYKRAILQGRHYGLELVGISQRPQDVAARFRDNAAVTYAFALHDARARAVIGQTIGKEADDLGRFERFDYLRIEAGVVAKGRTEKPGATAAPAPKKPARKAPATRPKRATPAKRPVAKDAQKRKAAKS